MTQRPRNLAEILDAVTLVLLDFDGPVCRVFIDPTAKETADQIREAYAEGHGSASAGLLLQDDDPLEVIRHAAVQGLPHADELEAALSAVEVAAMKQAKPTPHAGEAMTALRSRGLRLAAVSNNSTQALRRYFEEHQAPEVSPIVGREPGRVAQMKPDPHTLREALRHHGVSPEAAVMVGDSATDMQAARAAGTFAVGFANKPGKAAKLQHAGADVVITDMAQLAQLPLSGE